MEKFNIKQLPNCITILRLILVVPIIINLLNENYHLAFYLFIIAGLSDGLDGFLARHFHWTSQFGAMVDPLADKLLMVLTYLVLGYLGHLPIWLVVMVIGRDLIIIFGWLAYRTFIEEPVYNATFISKLNTLAQLLLVVFVILNVAYTIVPMKVIDISTYVVASLTLSSLLDYIRLWGRKAYLVKCKMNRERA